jgi:hypothetical protein
MRSVRVRVSDHGDYSNTDGGAMPSNPITHLHHYTKMPPSRFPTEQEIWKITRRTIDIIEFNITPNVCLFGSAAVSLWADIDRVPHVRHFHLHPIILFPLPTERCD